MMLVVTSILMVTKVLSVISGYHSSQQTEGDPPSAAKSLMFAGFQYSPDDWHTKDQTYGIKKSSG
jgi:hypothetical protein